MPTGHYGGADTGVAPKVVTNAYSVHHYIWYTPTHVRLLNQACELYRYWRDDEGRLKPERGLLLS